MNRTFGAPGFARTGAGHAGEDSPIVRPMRPGNVVPGGYSLSSALAGPDRPVVVSADAAISELPLNSRSRRLIALPPCGPALSFDRSPPMTTSPDWHWLSTPDERFSPLRHGAARMAQCHRMLPG